MRMKSDFRFRTQAVCAGLALGVLGMPLAHATMIDGIVDQWKVDVSAVFDTTTVTWRAGEPNGTVVNNQLLRWGSGDSGPSSLSITNPAGPGFVNTNGPAVANVSVTHANNPIASDSGELRSVNIISTLTLTPNSPLASGFPPTPLTFTIHFDETPNADNPCLGGGANGSGINVNGCADVFVINQNSLNFPFFYDLDGAGALPNQQYYISFFEQTNALNPLPAGACSAAGVAAPCIGFRTPENLTTTFNFAALITTERVSIPEPGSLALLGLGLAGFGLARRRKS